MRRRQFLRFSSIGLLGPIAGCSSDSGPDIEKLDEQSKTIAYFQLVENEENFIGEKVNFPVADIQNINKESDNQYNYLLSAFDPHTNDWYPVIAKWAENPSEPETMVEFWGEYQGLTTTTVDGNEQEVPSFKTLYMDKIPEDSGDSY